MKLETVADRSRDVLAALGQVIVGKSAVLRQILSGILANGHILIEDYPGLAKTLIARLVSESLDLGFKRIQFTPDLLPSDITGSFLYDQREGRFEFRRGPIFTNLLLADEINRATPKTQSALLEAMQEYQVTLEGETHKLTEPFIVIATQNPIEYEGTFPLPEAQLDRFMVKLSIGYPRPEEEDEILRRRTERGQDTVTLQPVTTPEIFMGMRNSVEEVYVDPDLRRYIVDLAASTRSHRQVVVGASPRGSLALLKLARAWAAIQGRAFILPDDIKEFARPVLAHRMILDPSLWGNKKSEISMVGEIIERVPVPVLQDMHE